MKEEIKLPGLENREESDLSRAGVVGEDEKDEKLFQEFVDIDKKIFPDMSIEEDELRESFESDGVQVVLRDHNNDLIGYLLSVPYEQAILFLQQEDPLLVLRENTLYIESIGILPYHRSLKNILSIWGSLKDHAIKKGYKTVNGHFRVSQGLSQVVQKRLKGKYFRTIDNWVGYGEPFDYIEIGLVDEE